MCINFKTFPRILVKTTKTNHESFPIKCFPQPSIIKMDHQIGTEVTGLAEGEEDGQEDFGELVGVGVGIALVGFKVGLRLLDEITVGSLEGLLLKIAVGCADGDEVTGFVGDFKESIVGRAVTPLEGTLLGEMVGGFMRDTAVGPFDGALLGVGDVVGIAVGAAVGTHVGKAVGTTEGAQVGAVVGESKQAADPKVEVRPA
eukprot:gene35890-48271_t